jgi:WD40 repeat protein
VALSEDGKTAVSGSDDNTLKVWDVARGACLASFTADGALVCVALKGDRVFAGDALGHVHLFALKL